jgi:hypothetical protein
MMNRPSCAARYSRRRPIAYLSVIAVATLLLGLSPALTQGQSQATEDLGGCTLKDHVYHCDGAVFQKALNDSSKVQIETHNADGVARDRLTAFVTGKLGKTVVPAGSPADLSFLMLPVDDQGIMFSGDVGGVNLGTLRMYTVAPTGSRGHLLWAETFNGPENMPWPAVVRGLILQFQSRFHIK